MNRLIAELQRLHFLPDPQRHRTDDSGGGPDALARALADEGVVAVDLVGSDGLVRALAIGFERAAHWPTVADLLEGLQADLDLPEPAVSVSGKEGYCVWLSLAEPVPAALARAFLDGLRRRYLAALPAAALRFHPDADQPASGARNFVELAPALDGATGKWSAFIDSAMGSMFADEPGLEMVPNLEKQADLLAGCRSIPAADFQRALDSLRAPAAVPAEAAAAIQPSLAGGGCFSDPKSFLLAVMNDPAASPALRVEAAKALLSYFEGRGGEGAE